MRKRKLKLFVWTNFCRDWTPGLAFAIAKDEESARAIITDGRLQLSPDDWGDLTVYPLSKPIAKYVQGGG